MNINKLVSILLVRKKKIMILLEVSVGRGRAPGVGPRIRGFFCFAHQALPTAHLK